MGVQPQPQPPILMFKRNDPLPLVDVASTLFDAQDHLSGHDVFDQEKGGYGVLSSPDNLYYDSAGYELVAQRTESKTIELIPTEQQIDLESLRDLVLLGFNALSASIGMEAVTMITLGTPRTGDMSNLVKKWPPSEPSDSILRPADPALGGGLLDELARRFAVPEFDEATGDTKGSLFHTAWHIAKGICLSCRH
jgi:hypothetical protein